MNNVGEVGICAICRIPFKVTMTGQFMCLDCTPKQIPFIKLVKKTGEKP